MQKFETLDFYLETAKRAIGRWGHPSMKLSEDAISDVAYMIMRADQKFDGRGDLKGFRMYYARCGILKLITKYNRDKHRLNTVSLDTSYSGMGENSSLHEFLADGHAEPCDQYEIDNVIDMVNSAKSLRDREKRCVVRYNLYGDTLEQISSVEGITKEAVRLNVLSGIKKLREELNS